MIQLSVEVSNLDGDDSMVITLPCNLRSELPEHYNYIILACYPDIPLRRNDDIQRLNDVLEDINSENPGMTEEYLDVLTEASQILVLECPQTKRLLHILPLLQMFRSRTE